MTADARKESNPVNPGIDMQSLGELDIRKLIDCDRLQRIQDRFAKATGLALIAVDCKGVPITAASSFTNFCSTMRQDPIRQKRCFSCDAHGGLQAAINGEPYVYQCHAGLVDFSVPIVLGNNYLGAILCGQVQLVDGQEKLDFVTPIDTSWIEDDELRDKRQSVFVADYDKLISAAETLRELTNYLVEREYAHNFDEVVVNKGSDGNVRSTSHSVRNIGSAVGVILAGESKSSDIRLYAQLSKAINNEDLSAAVQTIDQFVDGVFKNSRRQVGRLRISGLEDAIVSIAQDASPEVGWEVQQSVLRCRAEQQAIFDRYETQLYLESLVFDLYDCIERHRPSRPKTIRDLLNQIEKNVSDFMTSSSAANYLNVSSSYLSKAFKAETGTNYLNYVTNKRISRAKMMLAYTDIAISSIAVELGFRPTNYFTRIFKKVTGETPSQYRSTHQSGVEGASL